MKLNSKVCLTTYIYGVKYQKYIPLLLFSCSKAYPEYDVVLFLYEKLDPKISEILHSLNLKNKVIIKENHFSDCPKMSAIKSKAFRWVLWDEVFNEYDFLYTVDIDMFYIKEPIPLHIQHSKHMDYIGLPISNIQREIRYNPIKIKTFASRIKKVGFKSIFRFVFGEKKQIRTTGLHFVDIKKYYKLLSEEKRNKFINEIYSGKIFAEIMVLSDEIFLTRILKDIGIDTSKFGIQNDSIEMLDFSNPERLEFRPHHGIHLGVFRGDPSTLSKNITKILQSQPYKYYVEEFKNNILNDEKFKELFQMLDNEVRGYFNILFEYYDIKTPSSLNMSNAQ